MGRLTSKIGALGGAALLAASMMGAAAPAAADGHLADSQIYNPTVWIDPDGCEHWVMDDGAEGYMSPHRNRDGSPVCRRSEICGIIPTDQLFATDRHHIDANNRARLATFFQEANAFAFLIYGHTDARASDAYNLSLSDRRANAVAHVAQSVGANVVDVRGFGERQPRAAGHSAAALQENRRVEIYCLR